MPGSNIYYTLVSSLPHLPPQFEGVERLPVTRIRLRERLRMLQPADMEVVEQVLAFLQWERQHRERTDEDVIRHYDRLMRTIANPLVRHIVAFRMDVRTIMSSLRRRRRGLPPPPGVGQWVRHIERHWDHPDFNLGRRHPWIAEAEQALDRADFVHVERQVLQATWNEWTRLSERYYFSFEVVILYLVRWEILNRWTRLNAELGRERFDRLVEETLGEYANIGT
jgi:hypothetical protein